MTTAGAPALRDDLARSVKHPGGAPQDHREPSTEAVDLQQMGHRTPVARPAGAEELARLARIGAGMLAARTGSTGPPRTSASERVGERGADGDGDDGDGAARSARRRSGSTHRAIW